MKAFINTNSKNNIVNSPNSNPINNLNPDKNITTRINLEKLKFEYFYRHICPAGENFHISNLLPRNESKNCNTKNK